MDILYAMQDARFVEINGRIFVTGYHCLPDEGRLVADDIVLEASAEGCEIELTLAEVRDADEIGEGAYRLRSGAVVCFFPRATLH